METTLPEYLSWFGVEQILWLCAKVMNFIYTYITPSVWGSIVMYALFSHLLFLPFTIKNGIDKRKDGKVQEKVSLLQKEFMNLPEEEREKEEVKEEYRKRKKEIMKGKSSTGLGCLLIIVRLFLLISAMPVISLMHIPGAPFYVEAVGNAYNFLGFNLLEVPGLKLTPSIIFPLITAGILSFSGFLSTKRNLDTQKKINESKTKEEREEEKRLLAEMGVKQNKIPVGYIIQGVLTVMYFYTFSNISLSLSLYWIVYYSAGFGIGRLVDLIITKTQSGCLNGCKENA